MGTTCVFDCFFCSICSRDGNRKKNLEDLEKNLEKENLNNSEKLKMLFLYELKNITQDSNDAYA
jgi:hypothetical protein